MIRSCILLLTALLIASTAVAQSRRTAKDDTLHVQSPEVIVTGFPTAPESSVAPSESISRPTITALATEQDVPKIASITPSAIFYSISGTDVGYTHISLRGFDQPRLSVMVNGIPQNGPEDQEVYWIDIPGLQANASGIDIQRGAGTAYYGPPAIGGSINVQTNLSPVRSVVLTAGYGTYNTRNYAIEANSGLVAEKYIINARLAQTHTDGYRHASWLDRTPYFFSVARYDSTVTTQINVYGGPFNDGLNYYGIDKASLDGPDSIRRYNYSEPFTYERRPEEGERFTQPHYELLNEWRIGEATSLYNTVFYVEGRGYFDIDGTWPADLYGAKYPGFRNIDYYRLTPEYAARYGFTPLQSDSGFLNQIYEGFVGNQQWGWMPRLEWKHDRGTLNIAGELRFHRSNHWGELLKATELPADLPGDYHFYDFKGAKDIMNLSAIEEYTIAEGLHATAGLQLVNERYRLYDEKPLYVDSVMASFRGIDRGWTSYDFTVPFTFLNPRVGLSADVSDALRAFASYSITSREPRLTDYYNAEFLSEPNFALDGLGSYDFSKPLVHPETLRDIEVGAELSPPQFGATSVGGSIGFYDMAFTDEIVRSNHLDKFGAPVQLNARSTVHYGVELQGRVAYSDLVALQASLGLSHNEILDIDTKLLNLSDSIIGHVPPGFPSMIANGILTFTPASWLRLDVLGRYMGALYADIENTEDYRLDPYFVADAVATFHVPDVLGFGFLEAKLQVNNLLDRNYAEMVNAGGFFPGAPRHYYATISVGL